MQVRHGPNLARLPYFGHYCSRRSPGHHLIVKCLVFTFLFVCCVCTRPIVINGLNTNMQSVGSLEEIVRCLAVRTCEMFLKDMW